MKPDAADRRSFLRRPAGGVKQIEKLLSRIRFPERNFHLFQRGPAETGVKGQNRFSPVRRGINERKLHAAEGDQRRINSVQILFRSLIGPSAFAVACLLIREPPVRIGPQIHRSHIFSCVERSGKTVLKCQFRRHSALDADREHGTGVGRSQKTLLAELHNSPVGSDPCRKLFPARITADFPALISLFQISVRKQSPVQGDVIEKGSVYQLLPFRGETEKLDRNNAVPLGHKTDFAKLPDPFSGGQIKSHNLSIELGLFRKFQISSFASRLDFRIVQVHRSMKMNSSGVHCGKRERQKEDR